MHHRRAARHRSGEPVRPAGQDGVRRLAAVERAPERLERRGARGLGASGVEHYRAPAVAADVHGAGWERGPRRCDAAGAQHGVDADGAARQQYAAVPDVGARLDAHARGVRRVRASHDRPRAEYDVVAHLPRRAAAHVSVGAGRRLAVAEGLRRVEPRASEKMHQGACSTEHARAIMQ